MKDHVLLSSLRLENINTVFHEREEERGDDPICLPVCQVLEIFHPFSFVCDSLYKVERGGRWGESTCFSKSKIHRKVSHEWRPGRLTSFHAVVLATV